MTIEDIDNAIFGNSEIKNKVLQIAKQAAKNKNIIPKIWAKMLDEKINKRWRYAYLFDNINDVNPKMIKPYLPKIIQALPTLKDHGLRRHFTRIITKHPITKNENLQNILLDESFKYLMSAQIKVAVKAHAIHICDELCKIYPELSQEFCSILQEEMDKNTSAFKVRAKEILVKYKF